MFKIFYNYKSSNISFINIGGYVKAYIITDEIDKIQVLVKHNFYIRYIGCTSNIIFAFNKSQVILVKYINNSIKIDENQILFGSSMSLKNAFRYTLERGISLLEKIYEIPGTIGGSIINNSSCYDSSISDFLINILVLDSMGNIRVINKSEITFSHHESSLKNKGLLIISATFRIIKARKEELTHISEFCHTVRKQKQPDKIKTLGSTFKRVENICLPFIMEKLKLSALSNSKVGFSSKHINFLEIKEGATLENLILLIEDSKSILYNNISYSFDLEIEMIN